MEKPIAGLRVLFIFLFVSLHSQVFYTFPEGTRKISWICMVKYTEKMVWKAEEKSLIEKNLVHWWVLNVKTRYMDACDIKTWYFDWFMSNNLVPGWVLKAHFWYMKWPYLAGRLISAQHFSLKQIAESCTEINYLWEYDNIFGCFEVFVLKKLRQTDNFANFS